MLSSTKPESASVVVVVVVLIVAVVVFCSRECKHQPNLVTSVFIMSLFKVVYTSTLHQLTIGLCKKTCLPAYP